MPINDLSVEDRIGLFLIIGERVDTLIAQSIHRISMKERNQMQAAYFLALNDAEDMLEHYQSLNSNGIIQQQIVPRGTQGGVMERSELESIIIEVCAEHLGVFPDAIDLPDRMGNHFDSLDFIEVEMVLGDRLSLEFPTGYLQSLDTFQNAADDIFTSYFTEGG